MSGRTTTQTKKGRPDFRRWAKKYLKPGAFPEPVQGWGIGRKRYCPTCKVMAQKVTYKVGENKGCYCLECGYKVKEYLPSDYHKLYKLENKIPKFLWNLLDKFCLYREKTYKKVGSGA
jgi:hypothetical protein